MRETMYGVNQMLSLAVYLVGLLLTFTLFLYAYRFESSILPVVSIFQIDYSFVEDGQLYISGVMEKIRPCTPINVSVWELNTISGVMTSLDVDFKPDQFHGDSDNLQIRPEGLQTWGPWEVELPRDSNNRLIITATHNCHPMWQTDSVILDVPLSSLNVSLPNVGRPEL